MFVVVVGRVEVVLVLSGTNNIMAGRQVARSVK